jgi:hypothetical protein
MVLNFTFNNWSPIMKNRRKDYIIAIAVHEFGHAIGFSHEHNRKDCHFCDDDPQDLMATIILLPAIYIQL